MNKKTKVQDTEAKCAIQNVIGILNTIIATVIGSIIGLMIGVVVIFILNYL